MCPCIFLKNTHLYSEHIRIRVRNPYNSTLAVSPGPGTSKFSRLSTELMYYNEVHEEQLLWRWPSATFFFNVYIGYNV